MEQEIRNQADKGISKDSVVTISTGVPMMSALFKEWMEKYKWQKMAIKIC